MEINGGNSYKLETEALAAWWLSACGEVVSRTGGNGQQLSQAPEETDNSYTKLGAAQGRALSCYIAW
jgi:hypothetical protein